MAGHRYGVYARQPSGRSLHDQPWCGQGFEIPETDPIKTATVDRPLLVYDAASRYGRRVAWTPGSRRAMQRPGPVSLLADRLARWPAAAALENMRQIAQPGECAADFRPGTKYTAHFPVLAEPCTPTLVHPHHERPLLVHSRVTLLALPRSVLLTLRGDHLLDHAAITLQLLPPRGRHGPARTRLVAFIGTLNGIERQLANAIIVLGRTDNIVRLAVAAAADGAKLRDPKLTPIHRPQGFAGVSAKPWAEADFAAGRDTPERTLFARAFADRPDSIQRQASWALPVLKGR